MIRDFTYIDDIVEGVIRVFDKLAEPDLGFDRANPDPASSFAPYRIFNVGNNHPVQLLEFLDYLEDALGRKAIRNFLPIQPGDLPATNADVSDLQKWIDFKPITSVREGTKNFVEWYMSYYGI